MSQHDMREAARGELRSRGLLVKLPTLEAAKGDLAVLAQKLERFSGFVPGSMLQVDDRTIMLFPQPGTAIDLDRIELLTEALLAAVPEDSDVRVVIIGSAGG